MGNFFTEYKKGQAGQNKGLYLGIGLDKLSSTINGLQRGEQITIASSPKVGKTTITDYGFVIQPYLYALEKGIDVEWLYYSLEMDRVTKEFDFATYFLYEDHQIERVRLPEGITVEGENIIPLSSAYLRGNILDDNKELVKVSILIEEKLKLVYKERIVPLFGKYDKFGVRTQKGKITMICNSNNPTGIKNYILERAGKRGKYTKQFFGNSERIMDYTPDNPETYSIVVLDHIRRLIPERGFNEKQNMDKMSSYMVELRDLLNYTFINIVHLNRSMSDIQRQKMYGDRIFPDGDMIKSSGNLLEDSTQILTLFNPNDDRYNLTKHFGKTIKDPHGNDLYPNLRSVHLVDSRKVSCPRHFYVEMQGNIKRFKPIHIK